MSSSIKENPLYKNLGSAAEKYISEVGETSLVSDLIFVDDSPSESKLFVVVGDDELDSALKDGIVPGLQRVMDLSTKLELLIERKSGASQSSFITMYLASSGLSAIESEITRRNLASVRLNMEDFKQRRTI